MNKKKNILLILLAIFLVLFSGCSLKEKKNNLEEEQKNSNINLSSNVAASTTTIDQIIELKSSNKGWSVYHIFKKIDFTISDKWVVEQNNGKNKSITYIKKHSSSTIQFFMEKNDFEAVEKRIKETLPLNAKISNIRLFEDNRLVKKFEYSDEASQQHVLVLFSESESNIIKILFTFKKDDEDSLEEFNRALESIKIY